MYFPRCTNPVGIFPDKDKPINPIYVPCGRCKACLISRASAWSIRCLMEYKFNDNKGVFLTLTYDNNYLDIPSLRKHDLQCFFKRLRNDLLPDRVRYFACGEYGESTHRPHYHILLFGVDERNPYFLDIRTQLPNGRRGCIASWQFGFVHLGYVSEASCQYVAKYVLKSQGEQREHSAKRVAPLASASLIERPFQLMSRRPALGDGYMRKYYKRILLGVDPIVRFTCLDDKAQPHLPRFIRERCELYERLDSDNGFEVQALQELRKESRIAYAMKQQKVGPDESIEEANFQRKLNFDSMVKKRGVL